jgi:acyl-[acyl-carrier-protein] desaturase
VSEESLLRELQPKVETLLERHLKASKEWFPHTFVPWERGVEMREDDEWDPNAFPLPDAVRSALFVNLLTEDNLPYYHSHIERIMGANEAWDTWNHRWTAEEDRHAMVIRNYLTVTQAVDPFELERARMQQMSKGIVPTPPSVADTLAYVSLQELATRIAHRNTGKLIGDPAGYNVMVRVATDENLHFLFYRDAFSALLEIDPSAGVIALERQVREFQMPGTGIPNFKHHALLIAQAGIYNLSQHHDQILVPVVLRHYAVESLTGLSDEAERARDALLSRISRIGRAAERAASRQATEDKDSSNETVSA